MKKSLREEAINELTEVYNKKYQDLQETDAEVMAKLIAHWEDAKILLRVLKMRCLQLKIY